MSLIFSRNNGSLLSYAFTQTSGECFVQQDRTFRLSDKNGCSLKFMTICLTLFFFAMLPVQANVLDWRLWDADGKLKAEKFSEAKDQYLKIQVSEPNNARLNYNLGIANYREGALPQAMNSFQLASAQTEDKNLQEKALYNLGNAQFKLQDFQTAINSYERALKIDPEDEDTKHNLGLAKKKLEEQKQEEQKDGDQKKDGENDDENDDEKDSDKQDDKEGEGDQDRKDKDDKQDQNQKPKPQNQPQQPKQDKTKAGGLSQQDVERMLMQVEEADPSEVNQNRANARGSAPNKNLKPW